MRNKNFKNRKKKKRNVKTLIIEKEFLKKVATYFHYFR